MRPSQRSPLRVAFARAGLLLLAWSLASACTDKKKRIIGETCGDNAECDSGFCFEGACMDANGDDDGDGLSNGVEAAAGSDPRKKDSDDDGVPDKVEFGDDPNKPLDGDGDGLPDAVESSTGDADHDCIADQDDLHNDVADPPSADLIASACPKVGVCVAEGATAKITVTCAKDLKTPVCDLSQVPNYQATETTCDTLDNDCDGQTDEGCVVEPQAPRECDLLPAGERTSGRHVIDPDGPDGKPPFEILCSFDFERGGWTRLERGMLDAVEAGTTASPAREYFYRSPGADTFYRSPVTTAAWSTSDYAEAAGFWVHAQPISSGGDAVFDCAGGVDGEQGVGCATADVADRVLPSGTFDDQAGATEVCGAPTNPNDAQSGCVAATEIWVRSRACVPDGKGLLGDGEFDLVAAATPISATPCWQIPVTDGISFDNADVPATGLAPVLVAKFDIEEGAPDALVIKQDKASLIKGRSYRLSFWAKSKPAKTVHVHVHTAGATRPADDLVLVDEDVAVSTTWAAYKVEFDVATTVWNGEVEIGLGGAAGTVRIDAVHLDDIGQSACPPCSFPNASALCVHGKCAVGTCDPAWGNCDGKDDNGCERPLWTLSNCRACDDACTFDHGVAACGQDTGCTLTDCKPGWGNCDGKDDNGCETQLGTAEHCKSCQDDCNANGAIGQCEADGCVIVGCQDATNYADCDGKVTTGCETPLGTLDNCKDCGDVCTFDGANGACKTTGCGISGCKPGRANCDNIEWNGCETTLGTPAHCRSCEEVCHYDHGVPICTADGCGMDGCQSGYGNCDSNTDNGCETPLGTVQRCLSCTDACAFDHAVPVCESAGCTFHDCESGYGNCNPSIADGCETPLGTMTNCTKCGDACHFDGGSAACQATGCKLTGCNSGRANCDNDDANGCETTLGTIDHCKSCDDSCNIPGAIGTCGANGCTFVDCSPGLANCDGDPGNGCETTLGTTAHCRSCAASEVCVYDHGSGACTAAGCNMTGCDSGYQDCNHLASDGCETQMGTTSNCKSCGDACTYAGGVGLCGASGCSFGGCLDGRADCNSSLADGCETTLGTTAHCRNCGESCSYAHGNAVCTAAGCGLAGCTGGYGNCDSNDSNGCETTLGTTAHCKSCTDVCSYAHAGATCGASGCAMGSCDPGYADCNHNPADGCEVPLGTLTDCKACGDACSYPSASAVCGASGCALGDCNNGRGNCDGNAANGCETALGTVTNCKSCGDACTYAGGSGTCTANGCSFVSCDATHADCDTNTANGCETTLGTLSNCKSCNDACSYAHASAVCGAQGCALGTCNNGYKSCDSNAANGCETPLGTLTDCKDCGDACSYPHGIAACGANGCQMTGCADGWADCNHNPADGCEVPLGTLTDCKACGDACSYAFAAASCGANGCAMGACNAGHGNCDGSAANGCETPLGTLTNCLSCGDACTYAHAGASCDAVNGCAMGTCNNLYGDCNTSSADGCETPLNTLTDCATCGTACARDHASVTCATGTCQMVSCDGGYGNCNNQAGDGCEQSLNTLVHCGACNQACSVAHGTPTCATGTCAVSACDQGYQDCDGSAANGCEVDVRADQNNCGACGNVCEGGEVCVNSACVYDGALSVTGGSDFSCALRERGSIVCWGRNTNGQLGDGTTTSRSTAGGAIQPPNGDTFTQVAAGVDHACYLTASGKVACWGNNAYGQLGVSSASTARSSTPLTIAGLGTAKEIHAGNSFTCAITSDNHVWCWGRGSDGRLGNNSTANSTAPVEVRDGAGTAISTASALAVGSDHACAITATGVGAAAKCWGYNGYYQLGTGNATSSSYAVAVTGSMQNANAIVAGYHGTCVKRSTSTISCWGYYGDTTYTSQSTNLTAFTGSAIAMASGSETMCVLKTDGHVSCMGVGDLGQIGDANFLTQRGNPHEVVRWSDLTSQTGFSALGAGYTHFCGLDGAKSATCWGAGWALGDGQVASASFTPKDRGSAFPVVNLTATPIPIETAVCANGRDDDHNGNTDCADAACATDLGSATGLVTGVAVDGQLGNYVNAGSACYNGNSVVTGRERRFRWTAPETRTYVMSTDGSNADTVLDVRTGGCSGSTVICADDITAYSVTASRVELAATQGTEYTLFLDNKSANVIQNMTLSIVPKTGTGGWLDCDGLTATGYEVDGQHDRYNCGACGKYCAYDEACVAGTCSASSTVKPTAITSGEDFSCALRGTGAVACWGKNAYGQLGDGTTTTRTEPRESFLTSGATQITAGYYHVCARMNSGRVQCWGDNSRGQIGRGYGGFYSEPVEVPTLSGVAEVSSSGWTNCARTTSGEVWCWGSNDASQIGDGTTFDASRPVKVALLHSATAISVAVGRYHACALTGASSAQCWGSNSYGGLGSGDYTNYPTPHDVQTANLTSATSIYAGNRGTCAVRTGLAPVCWGYYGDTTYYNSPQVTNMGVVTAMAMDLYDLTTCGIRSDGHVVCMGDNTHGQTGSGSYGSVRGANREVVRWSDLDSLTNVTALGHGEWGFCAIAGAGAASCWGAGYLLGDGQLVAAPKSRWSAFPVTTLAPLTSLAALGTGETAQCTNGYDDDGNGDTDCADAACARYLGSALGKVFAFSSDGQLGNYAQPPSACQTSGSGRELRFRWVSPEARNYIVTTEGSNADTTLELRAPGCGGTLLDCNDDITPGSVTASRRVLEGDVGQEYTLVVDTRTADAIENVSLTIVPDRNANGSCSGGWLDCDAAAASGCEIDGNHDRYNCGSCGNVCAYDQSCVAGVCTSDNQAKVVEVTGGEEFSCARRASGAVACWGKNAYGQLGDGTTTPRTEARETLIKSGATQLTAGYYHACALMDDARVMCWGDNEHGQVGRGNTNFYAEPVIVPALSNVAEVHAGGWTTCARKTNGEVWCWGYNETNELGDGTTFETHRPQKVALLHGATAISVAVGRYHACALTSATTAQCWGSNSYGGLGTGNYTSFPTPQDVQSANLTAATAIYAGNRGTCVVRTGLSPVCWGYYGDTTYYNAPQVTNFGGPVTAMAMDLLDLTTCGIRSDGHVACIGDNTHGQTGSASFGSIRGAIREVVRWADMDSLTSVAALGGGEYHFCAVDTGGMTTCWGEGWGLGDSQLASSTPKARWSAFPVTNLAPVQSIASLGAGETGLCTNGRDDDQNGQTDCGDAACATVLGSALGVVATSPIDGQLGNYSQPASSCTSSSNTGRELRYRWVAPSTQTYIISTEGSSADTTIDVRMAGCTGNSVSCNDDTAAIGSQSRVAFTANASTEYTLVVDDRTGNAIDNVRLSIVPQTCVGDPNWLDCDADGANGCEVSAQTDRYNCGACGKACAYNETCSAGACVSDATSKVAEVTGGSDFSCARRVSGAVACWGKNTYGQLGDGTTKARSEARETLITSGATQLAAGFYHVCALMSDGHVMCWGDDSYGEIGRGNANFYSVPVVVPALSNVVEIRASGYTNCARKSNGEVWCWGRNDASQLGDGTTFDSHRPIKVALRNGATAISVAVGRYHACALTGAASAQCWGSNSYGALGTGNYTNSSTPADVQTANLTSTTAIYGGQRGTCAVRTGLAPVCWGYYGDTTYYNAPQVTNLGVLTALAMDYSDLTTCGIRNDGHVICMGDNTHGQTGSASFASIRGAVREVVRFADMDSLTSIASLGGGEYHFCAVGTNGAAQCWGEGWGLGDSQLASSTPKARWSAFPVTNLAPIAAIADLGAGETGLCTNARDDDQDGQTDCADPECSSSLGSALGVVAAGPIDGQLGNYSQPANSCSSTSYTGRELRFTWTAPASKTYVFSTEGSSADTSLDLRTAGCTGSSASCNDDTAAITPQSRLAFAATASMDYTLIVDDRTGNADDNFRLSIVPQDCSGDPDWLDCDATNTNGCEVYARTDRYNCGACGKVCAYNQSCVAGACTSDANAPVVETASGEDFTCARRATGAVSCWGKNTYGQLGDGSTKSRGEPREALLTSGATQLAAGYYHMCALMSDGHVMCWGDDSYGQIGRGLTNFYSEPVLVPALDSVVELRASGYTNCARKQNGEMWCWGRNDAGQLGDGTTFDSNRPLKVPLKSSATAISVAIGRYHACALTSATSAQCWGSNSYGALGNGNYTSYTSPQDVSSANLTNATAIYAGVRGTCVLRTGALPACWGYYGDTTDYNTPQVFDLGGTPTSLSMLMGDITTCALRSDGLVTCRGKNNKGQLGNGSFTDSTNAYVTLTRWDGASSTGWLALGAGGSDHLCAVGPSNSVFCWGTGWGVGDNQRISDTPLDRNSAFPVNWLGAISAEGTMCTNGYDDDGNGKTDCADVGDYRACATDLGSSATVSLSVTLDAKLGNYNQPPSSCTSTGNVGRDMRFRWTAPSTGNFTITGPANTAVDVHGASCTSGTIGCTSKIGVSGTPSVVLSATAGVSYTIILDSGLQDGTAISGTLTIN